MIAGTARLTAVELFNLPEDERVDRWLIDGRLVERPRNFRSPHHARVSATVCRLFGNWAKVSGDRHLVLGHGCPFYLTKNPDWVVTFDLAVVAAAADITSKKAPYIEGPPILATEVLDQNDLYADIWDMIETSWCGGIWQLWLLNPYQRTVTVHRPDRLPELYASTREITAEPELQGFTCRVAELFE